MKITNITTSNFVGARAVDVKLDKPVALFAGKNFAGKSSLQEAVRMALTGESVRVGLKKDYGALVTEGQEAGFVQVDTEDNQFSIVLPAGKGVHADHAALPYVLDAQRFAHMPTDDRRAFLFGLMGVKLDGASVTKRMLDKGLDAKKVEQIAPFLRAGFDAATKEAQGKARDAKAGWKAVTNGETWGKDKAAKWQPEPLPDDAEKAGARHENAVAKAKEVEQELGAAQQALGAAKAKSQARQQAAAQREDLAEKAGRIDRIKAKLNLDTAEMVAWEEKVAATRQKAGVAPVNPKAPGEYLLRGLASVTAEFVELTCNYPEVEWESSLLNRAAAHLAEYRKLHGEPVTGDAPAQPDAEAIDLDPLQAKVAELTEKRDGWRADAEKYRAVADQAARRASLMLKASVLHQDVLDWTGIADALAPDGIPGELLAEALDPINEHLRVSAANAEWEPAQINSDMTITYGLRDYALISESEKWRADAMIAEAVSHLSGVKLLVLDRFDVLDLKGREDLLYWLDGMAADGDIDTALIFGTLKGLPALNFDNIEAHWIDNGAAGQIKEAA